MVHFVGYWLEQNDIEWYRMGAIIINHGPSIENANCPEVKDQPIWVNWAEWLVCSEPMMHMLLLLLPWLIGNSNDMFPSYSQFGPIL